MLSVDVKIIDREALVRLDELPTKLHTVVEEKFRVLVAALREKVEANLSGRVLNIKSGALISSLKSGVERQGSTLVGFVDVEPASATVKEYALAHEYGGKGNYLIQVGPKGVLANEAEDFFSRRDVVHPPAKERSYLRSALAESRVEIIEGLEDALFEAVYGR